MASAVNNPATPRSARRNPGLVVGLVRDALGYRDRGIAEPMYLARYIERMGTGIRDMIERCRAADLAEPEFRTEGGLWVTTIRRKTALPVTGEVTPEVAPEVTPEVAPEVRLARALKGEMTRREIQGALNLRDDEHFRLAYLQPALNAGLIEMTIPGKPTSRLQRYRLTDKGKALTGRQNT